MTFPLQHSKTASPDAELKFQSRDFGNCEQYFSIRISRILKKISSRLKIRKYFPAGNVNAASDEATFKIVAASIEATCDRYQSRRYGLMMVSLEAVSVDALRFWRGSGQ